MNTFLTTPFILFSLALSNAAFSACDGDPILKGDIEEKVVCRRLRNKEACVGVRGCEWTPETAKVRVCNQTDRKIGVAYQLANQSKDWATDAGWMLLEVGGCQDQEAPNTELFSVFALSEKGHFYWYGEGPTMCFDPQGKKYEVDRRLSESSCGTLTGIGAYQSIPLQPDDYKRIDIQGPGADLSPAPPVFEPTYTSLALAFCRGTSQYSFTNGGSTQEARENVMKTCGSYCNSCEVGLLTEPGKATCVAVVRGTEPFVAWGWAYNPKEAPNGKETAVNHGLSECQKQGQSCLVDRVFCNDEVVTP
jgi:hypothetical protein